jgi:hypothetical protein
MDLTNDLFMPKIEGVFLPPNLGLLELNIKDPNPK